MRNTISCLLLVLACQTGGSQTPSPWEFGLSAGTAIYLGETNEMRLGQKIFGANPGLGLHTRKNLTNNLCLRANLILARISGNDSHYAVPEWRSQRGLSVTGSLYDITLMAEFYPAGLYGVKKGKSKTLRKKRQLFSPFLALGAGVYFANPKVYWNDQQPNDYLDPVLVSVDKSHNNKPDISIPVGLGGRFRAGSHFTLGMEAILTPTLGDYMDGISVAGVPSDNDWYFYAGITGSYAFGKDKNAKINQHEPRPDIVVKPVEPDRDGDGIPDIYDQCPDGPGNLQLFGCPDTDGDGVADRDDHCPEEIGHASLKGCPDRDEDGIADKDDNCPDTKGVLEYRGCPAIDRDKDGVADAEDLCPDMRGQLRWKGCPDSDEDGLPDNKDACPGIAGPERLKGCPDSDSDGIADKEGRMSNFGWIA